jgi:hypothetical protein
MLPYRHIRMGFRASPETPGAALASEALAGAPEKARADSAMAFGEGGRDDKSG